MLLFTGFGTVLLAQYFWHGTFGTVLLAQYFYSGPQLLFTQILLVHDLIILPCQLVLKKFAVGV